MLCEERIITIEARNGFLVPHSTKHTIPPKTCSNARKTKQVLHKLWNE